jgi:hypothetical protein
MLRQKLGKAAVIAAVAGMTGVGIAHSAEAATYYSFDNVEAQADNSPGDRAPSWVWIHVP